jgi:hypothetical protein
MTQIQYFIDYNGEKENRYYSLSKFTIFNPELREDDYGYEESYIKEEIIKLTTLLNLSEKTTINKLLLDFMYKRQLDFKIITNEDNIDFFYLDYKPLEIHYKKQKIKKIPYIALKNSDGSGKIHLENIEKILLYLEYC